MTENALQHLLNAIGPGHITGFFLVLARVAPLFVLAPLFSSRMLPARARGVIAVAISIGLTGIATKGHHIPTAPLQIAGMMIVDLLVGLLFAFVIGALLAGLQAAGGLVDAVAGFSFGGLVDPVNGNQGGVMTQLYSLLGVMIFITIGGDAWTLRGLARTFQLVPVNGSVKVGALTAGAVQAVGQIFVAAIEVAAPVILAVMITDVAFGLVSRTVPQINVFAVGFPVKIGVALLVVAAALPFLAGFMSNQIEGSLATALHAIQGI